MEFEHRSVMPDEVHKYQNLKPGNICADCTLGGSGHALATVKSIQPGGKLIGIDQDIDAITNAKKVLSAYQDKIILCHRSFTELPSILRENHINGLNSVVLDLGFSLHQIKTSKRGFSFNRDEPLDMRMDTRSSLTAAQIVNTYDEQMLADIFFTYGEEKFSRKIARKIVEKREEKPFVSSLELAGTIEKTIPAKKSSKKTIHPATRVFQALRIAVNKELERLEKFMKVLPDMLVKGGRALIITFHSLEDRIVKHALRSFENGCTCPKDLPVCLCGFIPTMKTISKKPVIPSPEELKANPMARSSKLRVAQRI